MPLKIYLLLLSVLLLLSCKADGKRTATVVFISDTDVEIEVKDPIDGCPNNFYITRKITLKPGLPVEHKIDIDNFAFLNIASQQMNISKYCLLLLEGGNLTVDYADGKITVNGDNAKGIEYLNDNYIKKGLLYYINPMVPFMESFISDSIDFAGLDKGMEAWFADLQYKKDLTAMYKNGDLDKRACDILNKNLEYAYMDVQGTLYIAAIRGQIKGYIPTDAEKMEIFKRTEDLFSNETYLNTETSKYLYSSNDFYDIKYKFLNEEAKDKLEKEYDKSVFGIYIAWTLAPNYIQLPKFGGNVISEIQKGVGQFTDERFIQWFQQKFPDKEYTQIITRLYKEKIKDADKKEKAKAIFLDDKAISSFRDLAQTHELKGGYVYIDLWASWCSPCLAQFKYNGQLHELLAGYGNIQTVYISIDEDREEKTWRKQIDFHSLDGYHIRASKPLVNYISSALYEGKSVAVPRYLILNKNGDILDANLPRPSQITQLKEVLDQVIGKK